MTVCKGRKNNGGFTLLEIMFAAGTLALALSLLFGSLISINVMGEVNEGRTKASNHLSSVLEDLRSRPALSVLEMEYPVYTEDGVDMAVGLETFTTGGETVEIPVNNPQQVLATLPNAFEVRATVVWSDSRGRLYSMSSATICAR